MVLLLAFAGYTAWFVSGQPTISVDYFAKLNEEVRPIADESLNAAPHYLRAIELYIPDDDFEAATLDSRKGPGRAPKLEESLALNQWVMSNRKALLELQLGTAKPYCWFDYNVANLGNKPLLNEAATRQLF